MPDTLSDIWTDQKSQVENGTGGVWTWNVSFTCIRGWREEKGRIRRKCSSKCKSMFSFSGFVWLLQPLSKNPEALRACELSIIDEQVQTPIVTVQMEENGEILKSDNSSQTNSPTIATAVYPATERPMATLQPASPYPQLNNGIMNVDPSPARMCTVSHCHKILPGHHRFKRCEQHRLQNRHHSKLKRVRSKEGVNANDNQCQSDGTGNLDESKLAGNDDKTVNTRNSKKARKEKGNAQKSLVANEAANQSEPLTVVQENGSSAVAATRTRDTPQLNDADVSERVRGFLIYLFQPPFIIR